jgi:hypothetical protein
MVDVNKSRKPTLKQTKWTDLDGGSDGSLPSPRVDLHHLTLREAGSG